MAQIEGGSPSEAFYGEINMHEQARLIAELVAANGGRAEIVSQPNLPHQLVHCITQKGCALVHLSPYEERWDDVEFLYYRWNHGEFCVANDSLLIVEARTAIMAIDEMEESGLIRSSL